MRRNCFTKIQSLDARYPGLRQKVHAMFEEFYSTGDVVQMVQTQYGERLSARSIARYKSQHWQAQRDCVEQMSEAIGSSDHRVIEKQLARSIDEEMGACTDLAKEVRNYEFGIMNLRNDSMTRSPDGPMA